MRRNGTHSALAIGIVVVTLAACSFAPLPHEVDLRAQLADPTGEVTADIEAGEVEVLDLRVPADGGECFVFEDVAPGATVHSAQLHWQVAVQYEGPELSGKVQARAYATGVGDDVFDASNTLGPVVTVDLAKPKSKLAGTANLNPGQLEALNDRALCWGAHVEGRDVTAHESGEATISYEVERLRLRITFSVI